MTTSCSFCGKPRREVTAMVEADTNAVICDECFTLAAEQLAKYFHCRPEHVYTVAMAQMAQRRTALAVKP